MALRTTVKVGGISNLSDARYCSGMGVKYLGFTLDQNSDNYVDSDTLKTIKDWVVGPEIVGEFFTSDLGAIKEAVEKYAIDAIQVSDIEVCKRAITLDLPVIFAMDISVFQNPVELKKIMAEVEDRITFFLFFKTENTGLKKDDVLAIARDFKIMIAYGIDKENLEEWIEKSNIYGICLKGSSEIKPGFKDYDELADILELLEVD